MRTANELTLTRKVVLSGMAFGLFVLLCALILAAGELAVRQVAPRSDPVKLGERLEGSQRLFGLQPNLRTLQTGVWVETNSLGFRTPELPPAKPREVPTE